MIDARARHPQRVIVSRTDRIGDVVLTLPLCGLLKERLGVEVFFLATSYTRPVVECSPYVDRVLDWSSVADASLASRAAFLRTSAPDAIVHAFPRPSIAAAALVAGIGRRIGTSHRWYHWLTCNELEHLTRKRSPLHEAQLNVRLARRLLGHDAPSLDALIPLAKIRPPAGMPSRLTPLLDTDRFTLVLHPTSRGSSREWPLRLWGALIHALPPTRYRVVVTGSAEDRAMLRDWLGELPPHVIDLTGSLALDELITFLARVDGVVAASTGPLHLAAALGVPTLGLFPPTPPIHPGRWAPLGARASYLVAPGPCAACVAGSSGCSCMAAIGVAEVEARIEEWAVAHVPRGEND